MSQTFTPDLLTIGETVTVAMPFSKYDGELGQVCEISVSNGETYVDVLFPNGEQVSFDRVWIERQA